MAAKKLDEFTPDQEALIDEVYEEYLRDLHVQRDVDLDVAARWLAIAYDEYKLSVPARIEVVASPGAACRLASELTGEKISSPDWLGTCDGFWVSRYDWARRAGLLEEEETRELIAFRDFGRVAWDTILLDECAIVIRRPTALRFDDAGNLHSTTGPAIEWADGERDFAFHGEWMPERVIMHARDFSRDEYLALTNTEQRRAVGEIAGWAFVAELLGASIVDTWVDPSTALSYALLRCENGAKILRKTSPALKDGSQPLYFEPVHEDLRTAIAARKWQATNWTPAQCDLDPELIYGIEK